jgi:prevent-host-death family protein
MTTTTFSSREFNQDTGRAKKAAANGPVIITDRGKPAHVLLSFDEYEKLSGKKSALPEKRGTIVDLLAMPGGEDIEFNPPKLGDDIFEPSDFS